MSIMNMIKTIDQPRGIEFQKANNNKIIIDEKFAGNSDPQQHKLFLDEVRKHLQNNDRLTLEFNFEHFENKLLLDEVRKHLQNNDRLTLEFNFEHFENKLLGTMYEIVQLLNQALADNKKISWIWKYRRWGDDFEKGLILAYYADFQFELVPRIK